MGIKVTVDFRDNKKFGQLIRYIENNLIYGEIQEQIRILGHHTADHMRNTINVERKRPNAKSYETKPRGLLENSITAETLNTTGGVEVGVGRIAKLNAEAPYWEMINDGAVYTTKKHHIKPFEDGEFRTFKVGSTHIIEGIDFVGKAIRYLDKQLQTVLKKLGAKFIYGCKKASK